MWQSTTAQRQINGSACQWCIHKSYADQRISMPVMHTQNLMLINGSACLWCIRKTLCWSMDQRACDAYAKSYADQRISVPVMHTQNLMLIDRSACQWCIRKALCWSTDQRASDACAKPYADQRISMPVMHTQNLMLIGTSLTRAALDMQMMGSLQGCTPLRLTHLASKGGQCTLTRSHESTC